MFVCVCVDLKSLEGWRSKVLLTTAQVNRYSMSFSITAVTKNKMIKSLVSYKITAATLHHKNIFPKSQSINHSVHLSSIHLQTLKMIPNQCKTNQNIRSSFLNKLGVGIVHLYHPIIKLQNHRCQYRHHLRILPSILRIIQLHQWTIIIIIINLPTRRINHWYKVNPITATINQQLIIQKLINKSALNHNLNRDSTTFQIVILIEMSWSYSKQQRIG